jgi:hypothetical protein
MNCGIGGHAMRPLVICLLGIWAISAAPASAQNLIADGSFEVGLVGGCSQGLLPSTWFHVSLTPDVYSFDCGTLPGLAPTAFGNFTTLTSAHDGLRFVAGAHVPTFVEAFGQTLTAPLQPGANYRLSGAFVVADEHPEPGVIDVYLATGVTIVGATLLGSLGSQAVTGSWTTDSVDFTAPNDADTAMTLIMNPRSFAVSPDSYPGSDSWELVLLTEPQSVPAFSGSSRIVLMLTLAITSLWLVGSPGSNRSTIRAVKGAKSDG